MIYRFNKCSRKELVRLRDRISEMLEKEPNTQEFTKAAGKMPPFRVAYESRRV